MARGEVFIGSDDSLHSCYGCLGTHLSVHGQQKVVYVWNDNISTMHGLHVIKCYDYVDPTIHKLLVDRIKYLHINSQIYITQNTYKILLHIAYVTAPSNGSQEYYYNSFKIRATSKSRFTFQCANALAI